MRYRIAWLALIFIVVQGGPSWAEPQEGRDLKRPLDAREHGDRDDHGAGDRGDHGDGDRNDHDGDRDDHDRGRSDWPTFRHDAQRDGHQPVPGKLAHWNKAQNLQLKWTFNAPSAPPNQPGFYSSPIVHKGRVFIGNGNGQFFALDARTGATLWTFPPPKFPVNLVSKFQCNPSSLGIAATASIARIKDRDVVIFGAPVSWSGTPPPPPLGPGPGIGDGHLFALDTTNGKVVWISPAVAQVTGSGFNQLHQQIGYSAPLVFKDRVYVGIADHCDNPIQRGKVVAVHLTSGAIDAGFQFESTAPAGTRGGGIWNGPAGLDDVYFTTGNTRSGNPTPPPTNLGLSVVRANRTSGAPVWNWQPVPYVLDDDPDWAEGITLMHTSCGHLAVSTQKDGWTWAMSTSNGHRHWSFPDGPWTSAGFTPGDGTFHGDTDYKRPGAAWGDVYIGVMGGLDTTTNLSAGYTRLHALDVCRPYDPATRDAKRVRWIKDVPGTSGFGYPLGPPTVTHGIVYVGTNQGHLVVIADPSVAPSGLWRCNDPSVPNAMCTGATLRLVPDPLDKDISIAGAGPIFGEPALAGDRVFLADTIGHVFMLEAP